MAFTTDAGFDAAAHAGALGVLYLVEMQFASGQLNITNWPVPITVGATTYIGVGSLGSVGQIKESEDGAVQTVDLELSQVSSTNLSLALGSVPNYQNKPVRIYVAVTDADFNISGTPKMRFAGFMNTVKIKRDGNRGVITLSCSTGGYDVRRNPVALRINHAQHQVLHPGERGLEYVADLIGKPKPWLTKRFQQI